MKKVCTIIAIIVIPIATILIIKMINAIKIDNLVGGGSYQVKEGSIEYKKVYNIIQDIHNMGEEKYSQELSFLLIRGKIWIAPNLKGRQGVYVNMNGMRRIYLNKNALLSPVSFLDKIRFVDIDMDHMNAFGYLTLVGTLLHEYIHYSKTLDEKYTYNVEIAFYKKIPQSFFYDNLLESEKVYYDWAIESATRSAQKAKSIAITPKKER